VVSVDVATAVFGAESASAGVPVLLQAGSAIVQQSLSSLELFLPPSELVLLIFLLLPPIIINLGEYPSMRLGPLLFFFDKSLVPLLDLLLHLFFTLFDQGRLEPLFELHVADFLTLLLLELFFLVFLDFY